MMNLNCPAHGALCGCYEQGRRDTLQVILDPEMRRLRELAAAACVYVESPGRDDDYEQLARAVAIYQHVCIPGAVAPGSPSPGGAGPTAGK